MNDKGELRAWFLRTDGTAKNFAVSLLPNFDTAYAMTIHQSQGSEFDHVTIVLPDQSEHNILSKQLIYTAITRARNSVQIISNYETLNEAVHYSVNNATGIATRFKESYGN